MSPKILITRRLMKSSEDYALKIFKAKLNKEDKLLTKDELISQSSDCDGILSSITENLDHDVITSPENISLLAKIHLDNDLIHYKKSQIYQLKDYSF